MSYVLRSILLLIVTLFVAYSHAAILLEYNSTSTNLNVSSNVVANPTCYTPDYIPFHPLTMDCLRVQDMLPRDTILGFFHPDGIDDLYRLPILASFRTCSVVIRLENKIPEFSSWNTIFQATRTLIHTCSIGTSTQAKTGGYTHVGVGSQIRIVVRTPPLDNAGLNDITNITASASTS